MPSDPQHVASLLRLRDEALAELEEADLAFTAARMRVERMESDLRIGRPEPPEYGRAKGHDLPEAEARVLGAFRHLLKLEDKIKLAG